MPGLLPDVDPDGLLEYSVVYSDRALNHMARAFRDVMTDISRTLRTVYGARAVVVVPGSGTFGMEAVARQFATGRSVLVLRNGWFSYRWSQILERGRIPSDVAVLRARRRGEGPRDPFEPAPVAEVVETIRRARPEVVFAPHVETSAGMLLPDDYLQAVGSAVRSVGGLFVLDCIASGTTWVDMESVAVDVLISAPQKGWSGSPCCGLVMLGSRARDRIEETRSTSFACDLRAWLGIMEAYESGGHAYHATMPTDGLRVFRNVMLETVAFGLARARERQEVLGRHVRDLLESSGFPSVAAEGFQAPGVVVSYTDDPDVRSGRAFADAGVQVAGGVPLRVGEGEAFSTFRIGLFGLDKLADVEGTVARLQASMDRMDRRPPGARGEPLP